MLKKVLATVLTIIMAIALFACNREPEPAKIIESQGGSYEVVNVTVESEYNGSAPENGGSYLLIDIVNLTGSLEDMENTFFGLNTTHAHITYDAVQEYAKFVIYNTDSQGSGGDVGATLFFEVPADFVLKDGRDFTLYSYESTPVILKYTPPKEGGLAGLFNFGGD